MYVLNEIYRIYSTAENIKQYCKSVSLNSVIGSKIKKEYTYVFIRVSF